MNRDEKRTRVAAQPPEVFSYPGRRAIYPHEPGGGTWLSVNDAGLCLALINWHTIKREPNDKPASRGQIIPALAGAATLRTIAHRLGTTRLHDLRPFRLLAFAPGEEAILELRWDLEGIATRRYPWRVRHWFSSGYDEPEAERQRGRTCAEWGASLGTSGCVAQTPRFASPAAWSIFGLHASERRRDGELRRSQRDRAARHLEILAWTALRKMPGNGEMALCRRQSRLQR